MLNIWHGFVYIENVIWHHLIAEQIHPGLCLTVFFFSPIQCNGMSNRFWGWGREDDEFYRRIKGAGLQVAE